MQHNNVFEKPLGYAQITSLSTAQKLTVPAGTKLILIQAEGQPIRWRDDGTDPTASVGYPLAAGAELRYTGIRSGQVALSFIEQTAGAKLNVRFYTLGEW